MDSAENPKKERKLAKKPVPDPVSIAYILEAGLRIEYRVMRVIFFVLYLTSGRVSEVLKLKRGDVETYTRDGENRMKIRIATLKNRWSHRRTLPILASRKTKDERARELTEGFHIEKCPEEKYMYEYLLRYLNAIPAQGMTLFPRHARYKGGVAHAYEPITRRMVYAALHKLTVETDVFDQKTRESSRVEYKLHPHYLRHCRLTDLANRYDLSEKDLILYAGHSDGRTIQRYVKGSLEKYE